MTLIHKKSTLLLFLFFSITASSSLASIIGAENTYTDSSGVTTIFNDYEVNSEGAVTAADFTGLDITLGASANIVGNGTESSAQITVGESGVRIGPYNTGTLNVSDGGNLTVNAGTYSAGAIILGYGDNSDSTLNITNGGTVDVYGSEVALGNGPGSSTLNIAGRGSELNIMSTNASNSGGDGRLEMGAYGAEVLINITNGGRLSVVDADDQNSGAGQIQLGAGGSGNNISVNVEGYGQVMTLWEQELTAEEEDIPYFFDSTIEEFEVYLKYREKFSNFVESINGWNQLDNKGEVSELFLKSLTPEEVEELLSYEDFLSIERSSIKASDWIKVGGGGGDSSAELNVSNYGEVGTARMTIYSDEGDSSVIVSDMGQLTADAIEVGNSYSTLYEEGSGSALLQVKGTGTINANVFVYDDGTLKGDGTINGDVIVDGGNVAPGNSPGTLTIDGDLTVNNGTLIIEVDGLGDGQYDIFNVFGVIFLGEEAIVSFDVSDETITSLNFLDFFTGYESFDISNLFDLSTNITFSGLDFFSINLDFFGTTYRYTEDGLYVNDESENNNVAPVPEPSTIFLLSSGLIGLGWYSRKYKKA